MRRYRYLLFFTVCFMLLTGTVLASLLPTRASQAPTSGPSPTPTITPTYVPSPTPRPTVTLTPFITPTASGQVLVVTKLDDTDDETCDQDCSLREAIYAADWGATINFAPGLRGTIKLNPQHSPLGIWIAKSLTINGPGPKSSDLVIDGSVGYLFFVKAEFAIININLLTIANSVGGSGLLNSAGTVNIVNSTFRNNRGAISNSGTMTITGSTFYGNAEASDGAIANGGALTIINSTFYSNRGFQAGAIYNVRGTTMIINSTFKDNSTPNTTDQRSASISSTEGKVILRNSIIENVPRSLGCYGPVVDDGNNLQWPIPVSPGDPNLNCGGIAIADPKLGPLQDNGGPTWTMAPQPGSAAIGRVPKEECLPTDQRGIARTKRSNGQCDIGAFQVDESSLSGTSFPATPKS